MTSDAYKKEVWVKQASSSAASLKRQIFVFDKHIGALGDSSDEARRCEICLFN
jgi:hypothetical protein